MSPAALILQLLIRHGAQHNTYNPSTIIMRRIPPDRCSYSGFCLQPAFTFIKLAGHLPRISCALCPGCVWMMICVGASICKRAAQWLRDSQLLLHLSRECQRVQRWKLCWRGSNAHHSATTAASAAVFLRLVTFAGPLQFPARFHRRCQTARAGYSRPVIHPRKAISP